MNDNQSTILTRIQNLQESEWKVLGTGYVDKFRLAKDLYDERMRLYDSMDTTYRDLSVDILNKEEELKKTYIKNIEDILLYKEKLVEKYISESSTTY